MNTISRYSIIFLLIVLTTAAGCGGIKLTVVERDIVQEVVDNLNQTGANMEALRIMEAEQTYPEEFTNLDTEFTTIKELVPQFLQNYQEAIPQRIKLSDDQKEAIIKNAFPLSQKTLKASDQFTKEIVMSKLEQIASNLGIIWSMESTEIDPYRRSETFAIAHNSFILAHKRYPSVEIPETMVYSDRLIEFNDQNRELVPRAADEALPDVVTTAEYIEKSNKICEKILFFYLAKRGETLVSVLPSASSAAPSTASERGKSEGLGKRILTAIDETFGFPEVVPKEVEQTYKVFFRRGGYTLSHLSKEERARIRESTEQFIGMIENYGTGQTITIIIRTVGYTDDTPLRENNRFVRNFIKALEESGQKIPKEQPARKKALNKSFSRLRALIINEHIQQLLKETLGENVGLNIISEIVGKGEEIPEGLTPPYNDEDRRICEVTLRIPG